MIFRALIICALYSIVDVSQVSKSDLPAEIVRAMEKGDAKEVGKYFNSSVELIFSDSRGVYGKAQAEQILKNFFAKNGDGDFKYKHLHTPDKNNYLGELQSGKGLVYRTCIFMKDGSIHQMRIENKDY